MSSYSGDIPFLPISNNNNILVVCLARFREVDSVFINFHSKHFHMYLTSYRHLYEDYLVLWPEQLQVKKHDCTQIKAF